MPLFFLLTPSSSARIEAHWQLKNIFAGLILVAATITVTSGMLSLVFDRPTPLWAVLGSTLALDAMMLAIATRLGPGRLSQLTLLLGPRRLGTLPLHAWAGTALLASFVAGTAYVALVGKITPDLVPTALPEALEGTELRWLTFIVVVLVGPFVEEVFFRGFVFGGLLRRLGLPVAVILSSLVFAVAHAEISLVGPAFLSGSAFALIYWRTGTIWPLILAHTAQNAIAFALSG